MVTVFTVLITVAGMLGVVVLSEWFADERRRRDHQRAIKLQSIEAFQLLIDQTGSILAKIPLAADLKTLDEMMSAHIQIFNRSIVSIEALDPLEEVIDDIYKAHRLVLDAYDEYFKTGRYQTLSEQKNYTNCR